MSAQSADELWIGSVERYHKRQRRQIRAAWFTYFCRMADSHRTLADEYERRAEALCRDDTAPTPAREDQGGAHLTSSSHLQESFKPP